MDRTCAEIVAVVQSHLMEAVEEFINSGADPAERMIHDTMDCELAYINTDHPQFLGGSRAIGIVMDRRSRQPDDSSEDDARPGHSLAGDLAIARHVNRTTGVPPAPFVGRSRAAARFCCATTMFDLLWCSYSPHLKPV